MTNQTETNWYADTFKNWPVKLVGPKPTADMLSTVHKLNARPGKQALAIAMALRDGGVTGSQIVIACGAPQLNKMRGYISDAILKRLPVPPSSEGHTVYKLELTAKGKQSITRFEARAAKLEAEGAAKADSKAKGTAKPKKAAKAKAVDKAASDVTDSPAAVAAERAHENGATA